MKCKDCGLEFFTAGGSDKHIGCPAKRVDKTTENAEDKKSKRGKVSSITETLSGSDKEFGGSGIEGRK